MVKGRFNGAGAVLCALLHSSPSPSIPSNDARVYSHEAPGVFYLDSSTLPRPPFPGFLQVPRLLREANLLRAAYPPPGPSLRRERGWTGQAPGAARHSSRILAPIFDPLGAVPAGPPNGRVTNTNCNLWSKPGRRCRSPTWVEEWSWPAASGGPQ